MRRRMSSAGAITSGPMPSPGRTAIWNAVFADIGVSGGFGLLAALMNTDARPRASDHREAMPRFAANLGYLFCDRPLLQRIDAAAAAGFKAVELQFPYDVPATAVKTGIEKNKLTILGLNTPPGERDGEFGLAAVPGREKAWQFLFAPSLHHATAI